MNILMAFNSNYCFPSLVTIGSLFKHNEEPVTIYVMYSVLTEEELSQLKKLVGSRGYDRLELLRVDEHAFEDLKTMNWISKETYYRLLAQKLLPETVERFLWLDSDVLVLQNLHDFYYQDMEGKLLVATSVVEEGSIHEHYRQMTLPKDTRYFNAGVLLYDLKAQRKVLDADIYENYLKVFAHRLRFADQDVLNAVFYQCVKYVEQRKYNLYVMDLNEMSVAERHACLKRAVILHYNGGHKPWNSNYSQLNAELFWKQAYEIVGDTGQYEALKRSQKNARQRFLRWKRKKNSEADQHTDSKAHS